jgi:hypothetical protein
MPEPGRTDPFADLISLAAGPIAAVIRSFELLGRGTEELMKGVENFNKTMSNLNETAERVNRLLNDFEEPIRAMLPQVTRTVKLADEMATRLSTPIDEVIPGLSRLAQTLDSPVLRTFPTDLGQFMDVVNDLGRRMSPLAQIAEQAGGLFGLRIPGFGGGSSAPKPAAAPAHTPAAPVAASTTTPVASRTKAAPRKKAAPRTKRAAPRG